MKSFEELMAAEQPKLLNCVHCGLCLDECPTYRISGDENNSPRGRLAIWRAIAEDRLKPDATTDFYSDECVGCLACVSACPANVPYGDILLETRAHRVSEGKKPSRFLRFSAALARRPRLLSFLSFPLRLARRMGLRPQPKIFPGKPALFQSTGSYARKVAMALKPSGPQVALLEGCVMDAVFREINFATVRVLAANGYQVSVPEDQGCCGAMHEHAGLPGKDKLDAANRKAFQGADVVLTNSSGCGLALSHALPGQQRDLIDFLEHAELKAGAPLDADHLYYDFPCHSYHGLGLKEAPRNLFAAIGADWSLAPDADRCCGSGGAYMMTHEKNSREILKAKSDFLNHTPFKAPVLATANHVCMMQWDSAMDSGLVKKKVPVRHLVQLLDESYQKAGYYRALGF
ncbi:MAG: (Fe-S)-binding protein [candidate division FCPU426 bacterium]